MLHIRIYSSFVSLSFPLSDYATQSSREENSRHYPNSDGMPIANA